jgi:hypothetical protein
MADLIITAANITPGSVSGLSPIKQTGTAGASITAGQAVYVNSSDGKVYLADSDLSAAAAAAVGVSLHAALTGQPITYLTGGPLNFGAILTAGLYYVVSHNAGGIAPSADLASGWYSTLLMYAYSTSIGVVTPTPTGIAVA